MAQNKEKENFGKGLGRVQISLKALLWSCVACILHSSPFFILQAHFFRQFYLNPSMILTGSWVDKPQRIDSQCHQKGFLI